VSGLNTSTTTIGRAFLVIPDLVWPCVYGFLALAACWQVGPLDLPLVADNQHYFFISERFASGVPPHVSHFDPKNALSMMLSGASIALGRLAGLDDLYSARALSIFATAACYALLWVVAHAYSRNRIVAHVSVLAGLTFSQFIAMGAVGARPKVFMVLFIICVLWAVQARRPVLAGLAAAAVFLCWQPGLLFAGFAPVALAFWKRPIKSMAYFVLGFVVLTGLYESYFVYQGAFYEQIEQAYRYPSEYMSGVEFKLKSMKTRFTWMTKMTYGPTLRTPVPLFGMAFLLSGAVWSIVRPRRALVLLGEQPEWGYLGSAGLAALLFLHLDYQGFPDRMIVEPILAIGFAMVVCFPLLRVPRAHRFRLVAWTPAVAGAVVLLATIARADLAGYRGPVLPDQRAAAAEVGAMIAEGKTVWALGCTHLLAMVHQDNWVHYGFFFRGASRYVGRRYGTPYMPYRDGELPDVILLSRGRLEGLARWLPRFYERDTTRSSFQHSVGLWAKRGVPLESMSEDTYRSLRARIRVRERQAAAEHNDLF
jgi:hypothetical protein